MAIPVLSAGPDSPDYIPQVLQSPELQVEQEPIKLEFLEEALVA